MNNAEKPVRRGPPFKEIIVSAFTLALIAGGATAALAGTNMLTKDTIRKINEETATAARKQVIDADSFEKNTFTLENGEEAEYYEALKNGAPAGYVFSFSATGKSSGLVVMTGVSADGDITGVMVTQDNETAGYVDKVDKAGLFERFDGKSANRELKLGTDIDAVAQATKTSKGVTDGVNQAIRLYNAVKDGR
jgi:electron transport complex protein RnfG